MNSSLIHALTGRLNGDIFLLLPELELLLFAVGILLTDHWMDAKEKYWNSALAMAGVFFSAYTLWMLRGRVAIEGELLGFHAVLIVDAFFLFFAALVVTVLALVILLSAGHRQIPAERDARYFALLLCACIGMMLMLSGIDLIAILLGLEIMALSCYGAMRVAHPESRSRQSLVRYLLASGFGTAVLLGAFAWLYRLGGSTNIGRIGQLLDRRAQVGLAPGHTDWLVILTATALIAGLFLKIVALSSPRGAPHECQGAPGPVAAFVGAASVASGLALLLRLLTVLFGASHGAWMYPLAGMALASLTWGNLAALARTNLKRLLVYSSIPHAGYILLGLVAGNETALTGIVYYLFAYVFMTMGAIAILMVLNQGGLVAEELADLDGLWHRSPGAALLLLVFMLSIAGIPPTAGFMSKYFIFKSLFEAKHPVLAALAALFIVVGFYNYSRVVVHAWRKPAAPAAHPVFGSAQTVVLTVTAFATLVAGLYPEPFLRLARYAFGE
jgi:NADH-quinone oxidoreductase subunit N